MECPNCKVSVDPTLLTIELNAEEDGVEINFECPVCKVPHFAILLPSDFIPVD